LDAADKQWHLTSPTPYDPPLTYGGWSQSRALGARIANILRTRETDDEIPATNDGEEKNARKRRHKVIIHSSPFLRCVQTSVAISAGLAQNPGHLHHRSQSPARGKPLHSSPRTRPTVLTGSPRLTPISEPITSKVNGEPQEQPENIKKSIIRVDAFLGEWLSPDYFEQITPPPSSIMMVAGAKADLLRREDYSNLIHARDVNAAPANQGFPGGWGSPVVLAEKDKDEGLLALSSLGAALPRRDRTSSLSSVGSIGTRQNNKSATNLSTTAPAPPPVHGGHGIYQPPIPTYAISLSDPIPAGYVAHARDACVDVDYQWDSMREPQNWGNGGEYGEEWSSMHKRFRKGLQQLVGWYRDSDNPGKLLTKTPISPGHSTFHDDCDSKDVDTDLVIILVTHGAGCNALIGALTNQPVLMDVGMASLTMAVRKPEPKNTPTTTPGATPKSHSRASSKNIAISDEYDVMLTANTDHLRSTSSTPVSSRTPSLAGISAFRDRYGTGGSFDTSQFSKGTRPITTSSNFGSIRRTASVAGSTPRTYSNSPRQMSIGLWSAPQPQEEVEEQEDDMILNFGNSTTDEKEEEEKENEEACDDEEDDVAPLGLWGTPRPPGYAEKIREIGPKRRWTVNERG
jgi:broad specificity phosphatase PhoE